MANDRTELSVSTEVLEKMAELAAKEVDGVAGVSKRTMDLKGIMKTKNAFKGIKVENINGAIEISAYICIKQNAKAKEVAEKVQQNIKDKIQTMTGNAVTRVNVSIADIEIENNEEKEEQ
ncbi:MAG: Asp23/Gls24 family envelope stress response protein [Acutalibacteraceae bacterium]|nr:Asp23/Gls24 family envelope stress response protein [Clostridia bacterium]MEE1329819.1 Asp23/Gls24 family envelope stress response protein [Acutalibacteraceae bacterium]